MVESRWWKGGKKRRGKKRRGENNKVEGVGENWLSSHFRGLIWG